MTSINIKVTNAKITDSVKDYVNLNIGKLQKFLHSENKVHVELECEPKHKTGFKYRAEVTILPATGLYASARGNDFFEAIDLCMPKIKEQLMKGKDKAVSQRRRLGAQRKRGR